MKKKLFALILAAALVFATATGTLTAFAAVSLEECDRCFQATVNAFLERDDVEGNRVTAQRAPIYDMLLQHMGYVYSFDIIGGEGYAIVLCDEGNYVAQEFVPSSQSPYAQVSGDELCVYVTNATYLKYNGEALCDIASSEPLPEEAINELLENAITYKTDSFTGSVEVVEVTVNYTSRTIDSYRLCKRIPCFSNPGGMVGACAAVAGSNILGYYDRFYENLIPNHVAGTEAYGDYYYYIQDSAVNDSMSELFTLMGGNGSGISESGFKSGLQQYCANNNLSCDFTQLMSGGTLSFSSVKQCIDDGKPLALLLSTYNVTTIHYGDNSNDFRYDIYLGNHVMVGFGYAKFSYVLTDGSNAYYEFVYVASGFSQLDSAFFNINYRTNINSVYKVYIH